MQQDIQEIIKNQITNNHVVLYMKGSPLLPQCGFSARVVQILNLCGIHDIFSVDVLEDDIIRQGIKDFTNWPTIPQLYVGGEFIGGCDIVTQLYESGELKNILQKA
jgi:monothiol glutaredoxin